MQGTISGKTVWLELRLPGESVAEQDFTEFCEQLGAAGCALESDAKTGRDEHVAWFATGDDVQHSRAVIAAAALLLGVGSSDIRLTLLGDDWETAWQRDWHGMPIGERLWVRPSFCQSAPPDRIDIVLDPGMAFGTGQHATTRLCLEAIERICDSSPPASMLDMGAGSGLLAIAAGKLGATSILAIDNDPHCTEACLTNAQINGVRMQVRLDDTPPAGHFDLVAANILAGPLIDMAPALARCVAGRLVLSGLLVDQAEAVTAAYVAEGLLHLRTDSLDEWASVELQTAR